MSRRTALLLVAGALTQLAAGDRRAGHRPAVDGRPLAADRLTALLARRADRLRTGELAALPLAELDYRPVGWDAGTVTAELRYRLLGYDDYPAVLQRRSPRPARR